MGDPNPLSLPMTAVASSLGSVVARCLCHPLDTIKARLQASTASTHSGLAACAAAAVSGADGGVRGLYRGVGASLVAGTPAGALYFSTYVSGVFSS